MKTPKQVEHAIQTISDFCRKYYAKKEQCIGCPIFGECRNWWVTSPDMWREENKE